MSYSFNNLTLSGSLDSTGTLNIGTSTATAINFGKAGVTTTFPGPISTTQPATFDDIDTTGPSTMLIGKSKATKVEISKTGVTTEIKGNLNTSIIDSSGTLKLGSSTASKVELGRSGFDTEVKGSLSVPTPSGDGEAANKAYVDSVAAGLDVKPSCDVKTTTNLTSTYVNGKLTGNANGALTVDGILTTTSFTILVANQTNANENGIYKVTQVGSSSKPFILTRTTYADTPAKCTKGLFTHILRGTVSAGHGYVLTNDIITMGTTAWVFSQMSSTSSVDPKNVGTNNIFKDKSGNIINFRGIKSNNTLITASQANNDVEITMNQANITGTGGLTSGSITSSFGPLVIQNLSTPPTNTEGGIYYDIEDKKLLFFNGTTWGELGAGGGGSEITLTTGCVVKQQNRPQSANGTVVVYASKVKNMVTLTFTGFTVNVDNTTENLISSVITNSALSPDIIGGSFTILINNKIAYVKLTKFGTEWFLMFSSPTAWDLSPNLQVEPFSISYKSVNNTPLSGNTWGSNYPSGPTVTITRSGSGTLKKGGSETITFTFSHDPGTTFTLPTPSGGAALAAGTNTGKTRTAIFTPPSGNNIQTYNITVPVGGFSYNGMLNTVSTSLSITADTRLPHVTAYTPSLASTVSSPSELKITFDENVSINRAGGDVKIYQKINGFTSSVIINASDTTQLILDPGDSKIVKIIPTTPLLTNSWNYILVDNTVIEDNEGNIFAALVSNPLIWNFNIGTPIMDPALAPPSGATGIAVNYSPKITFQENISIASGKTIEIRAYDDNTPVFSATTPNSHITVVDNGKSMQIDPPNALGGNKKYYVTIPPGTIQNTSGHPYNDNFTKNVWFFTTVNPTYDMSTHFQPSSRWKAFDLPSGWQSGYLGGSVSFGSLIIGNITYKVAGYYWGKAFEHRNDLSTIDWNTVLSSAYSKAGNSKVTAVFVWSYDSVRTFYASTIRHKLYCHTINDKLIEVVINNNFLATDRTGNNLGGHFYEIRPN